MKHQRPVNLNLTTLSFPPMAIASIFHRLSGVVLFLLLPVMLYFLSQSLKNHESFMQFKDLSFLYKTFIWAFGTAWWYHVVAGIRHMLMDCGWGESLRGGRYGAFIVIGLGIVGAIFLGVCL